MVKKKTEKKIEKEENKKKKELKKIDEDDEAEETGETSNENIEEDLEQAEKEIKELEEIIEKESVDESDKITIKASKPISQLKKGDKIKAEGIELEVDAHYVLMGHGKNKEMAIELFNPKTDKDFQLRYFSDQVNESLEFYELQEVIYVKKKISKVEW